jgi:membrane-associated phospholipid phosphatase
VDPQALIGHREGIVGAWLPATAYPPQRLEGQLAHHTLWEPWVRATLLDFELGSRLYFAAETLGNAGGFTLWDAGIGSPGAAPTAQTHRIVHLVRPPNGSGSGGFWAQQLELVANWADLRAERCGEILSQLTPPVVFWASVLGMDTQRHKWTLELLGAALRLANSVEMQFKHALACRRPVEMSAQLQPMIQTPGHGSLPSGHATEAHVCAYLLWRLRLAANAPPPPTDFEQLMRQAARVAINRTIAGVHFPVDSAAGQVLGLALGEYLEHRATGSASYSSWQFDGTAYGPTVDFDWRDQWQQTGPVRRPAPSGYSAPIASNESSVRAPLLHDLWTRALGEWQ